MLGTRLSVRKYKQHLWWWRTWVCEWVRCRERERQWERERDRHKEMLYSNSNSYKWQQPTLTKGYRVTSYSYYLRATPFMLFTKIAQTWVVQRDNVNTAIMHSYSIEATHIFIIRLKSRSRYYKGRDSSKTQARTWVWRTKERWNDLVAWGRKR